MQKKMLFLVSCTILFAGPFRGQCPPSGLMRNRIIYLKDSLKPPLQEQLKELQGYVDKMRDCPYKNDSTHVFLLGRIGDIYFKQADYLKAVQYRHQAIEIITANAGKKSVNLNSLPGRYYYLSVAYDSLNNFTEKMKALDSCSTIAMRLKFVDRACLIALYKRVEYYFDIGDYGRCIDYAMKCEMLGQEYADKNVGVEKYTGEKYASSSLGWHVNALLKLKKFELAEELLKNKIDVYKKAGLRNYLGLVYGQLAQVQEYKKNYDKAISYYQQSLKYYQEDRDFFNCKQTLKDIGYNIYFKHLNDSEKALAYYRKALKYNNGDIFSKTEDEFESLNIYDNIGTVYVQKSLYDSAFKYFQLAFDQIKPGSTEEDILHSTPQEMMQFKRNYYLTGLLINKGDAFRKQYDEKSQKNAIRKAISIYKVADQLLNRIKAEQMDLESKLFWRSDSRRLYENAIEACYLEGNNTDAFYFFERSRAVLLNDQLNEKRFMGEQDIMQQTQIKKKILQLQRESDTTNKSSGRFSELQNELFDHKQRFDILNQIIKSKNSLYYQSFLDSTVIAISDVRKNILDDHQALVELFNGDSAVYALIITAQNINFKKIDKIIFKNLSDSFTFYISSFDLINRNYDAFIKVSNQLYQLIFQNVSLPPGRIIVSPDGQYFPIEALVTSRTNQQITWFLNDYAVSYTYSARFLMNDFNSESTTTGKNFMGIAPVDYPSAFSLAALPGSDRSLYKIAKYFDNSITKVASQASRNNFMGQFSQCRVIQLYTHAAVSSINNEPVIYFSDSALYLSDLISEFEPITRLVVLSACETARGKIYQGEGVFSFNRGFAALGIPAAITNLWRVDSKSTYELTELFYKYLADGFPTEVALQKAKLHFIQNGDKEKSLPFYWAAPILVGKAEVIQLSHSFPWTWILTGGIGLSVIGISYILRRRRKLRSLYQ